MGKENCPLDELSSSSEDVEMRPMEGEGSQPTTRLGEEFPNGVQMSVDKIIVVSPVRDEFSI